MPEGKLQLNEAHAGSLASLSLQAVTSGRSRPAAGWVSAVAAALCAAAIIGAAATGLAAGVALSLQGQLSLQRLAHNLQGRSSGDVRQGQEGDC